MIYNTTTLTQLNQIQYDIVYIKFDDYDILFISYGEGAPTASPSYDQEQPSRGLRSFSRHVPIWVSSSYAVNDTVQNF